MLSDLDPEEARAVRSSVRRELRRVCVRRLALLARGGAGAVSSLEAHALHIGRLRSAFAKLNGSANEVACPDCAYAWGEHNSKCPRYDEQAATNG